MTVEMVVASDATATWSRACGVGSDSGHQTIQGADKSKEGEQSAFSAPHPGQRKQEVSTVSAHNTPTPWVHAGPWLLLGGLLVDPIDVAHVETGADMYAACWQAVKL